MVDYSIVIDFSGFQKIVDALGGIEIDVPESIVDTQYPTIYDSYETFRISRGLQVLDGKTALKYARSRHSTNDFSRSVRQQLVIRAIRERVLSLGYLTNTTKISDTYDIVSEHIDTDLSIDQMINLALHAKDIPPASIRTVGIHGECTSASVCRAGGYLYTPSRDMFGGASILLPENAIASKVSYYEDTRRLASLVLSYPDILSAEPDIVVINASKIKNAGANVQISLTKL
jgi:anionic cell wall polymer biosynthesis LytR-Cps2A-Psr (LCP) family protein